jgi:iron complex transport system permease protein
MIAEGIIKRIYLPFSITLVIILFILDVLTGPVSIPLKSIIQIIAGHNTDNIIWYKIITDFRVPKALTAVLTGIALSVSGLQMQTIFRNPLAGPYVLGISSGASLGVAVVILGLSPLFAHGYISPVHNWIQIIAAWIGSAFVLILILYAAVRLRDVMTILILGVLFGSAISALISVLEYFSHQTMLKTFVIWSMGSLGNVTRSQLRVLVIAISAGFLLSVLSIKMLNAMLIGETYAKSMGLNIKLSRVLIFASTSILAGSITAFCGPIGFIGIAVPHITRLIIRSADHRLLLPAVMLTGAAIMLISDMLSQLPGTDYILPINSVTALIGIPVVVWLILKKHDTLHI